jgi:hypothetical protein
LTPGGDYPKYDRVPADPFQEFPMPKITFIHRDGSETVVDAKPGLSVMETAVEKRCRDRGGLRGLPGLRDLSLGGRGSGSV